VLKHRINTAFKGPPSEHVGMILWFPFSSLASSGGSEIGGISAFFELALHTKLLLSKYCNKHMRVGPNYPTNGTALSYNVNRLFTKALP
ncbi:hypothetical protein RJ639_002925, partial [Escallonia herrerae]